MHRSCQTPTRTHRTGDTQERFTLMGSHKDLTAFDVSPLLSIPARLSWMHDSSNSQLIGHMYFRVQDVQDTFQIDFYECSASIPWGHPSLKPQPPQKNQKKLNPQLSEQNKKKHGEGDVVLSPKMSRF